ncbi:hypothetical protein OPQ81_006195 [Rhizoctonia solani]|nr:hypothetical protein OPQ81_006195 [Rhizoctonia solani]
MPASFDDIVYDPLHIVPMLACRADETVEVDTSIPTTSESSGCNSSRKSSGSCIFLPRLQVIEAFPNRNLLRIVSSPSNHKAQSIIYDTNDSVARSGDKTRRQPPLTQMLTNNRISCAAYVDTNQYTCFSVNSI